MTKQKNIDFNNRDLALTVEIESRSQDLLQQAKEQLSWPEYPGIIEKLYYLSNVNLITDWLNNDQTENYRKLLELYPKEEIITTLATENYAHIYNKSGSDSDFLKDLYEALNEDFDKINFD